MNICNVDQAYRTVTDKRMQQTYCKVAQSADYGPNFPGAPAFQQQKIEHYNREQRQNMGSDPYNELKNAYNDLEGPTWRPGMESYTGSRSAESYTDSRINWSDASSYQNLGAPKCIENWRGSNSRKGGGYPGREDYIPRENYDWTNPQPACGKQKRKGQNIIGVS